MVQIVKRLKPVVVGLAQHVAVNGTDSEAFKTTGPIAYEIYPNADIVTGRLDGYGAI